MTQPTSSPDFSVRRSLRLGLFQVGSSLTDLLSSAVVNRILIVEFGAAAWAVSLLSALRYLLAPLSIWSGNRSDTHPIFGSYRLSYIWIGRLLMLLSLPLLPLALIPLGSGEAAAMRTGWIILLLSFVLYGIGTLMSGSVYLALVHDSAPYQRRGQVIAIVQLMLVASFAFVGFLYGRLLPEWSPEGFWRLVLFAMIGAGILWIVSIWGAERRNAAHAPEKSEPTTLKTLRVIISDPRSRRYALFLGLSAFFAFMQDAMLEPFGGDVFGLSVGETTRFNAYWGMGVLVAMVATAYLTRRRRPDQQVSTTVWGLALLGVPLVVLGLASAMEMQTLLRPTLIAFGIGFGIFTIGGVSLLMAMNRESSAGAYLGLWSMIQLVGRGLGIAAGGAIRDAALTLTDDFATAYAVLFIIEAIGLFVTIPLLLRADVSGFAREQREAPSAASLLAATAE